MLATDAEKHPATNSPYNVPNFKSYSSIQIIFQQLALPEKISSSAAALSQYEYLSSLTGLSQATYDVVALNCQVKADTNGFLAIEDEFAGIPALE